jgi:hypothetical protein
MLLGDLLTEVETPHSYQVESQPELAEESLTMLFELAGGEPLRIKMIDADGWLILDLASNETLVFEQAWGHVTRLPLVAGAEGVWADPRDYVDAAAEVLAEEDLDGELCWVIDSKTEALPSRVWVGVRDGLPRRVENEEGVTRFVYSRFGEIGEEHFAVPPQLRVIDLHDMISGKS